MIHLVQTILGLVRRRRQAGLGSVDDRAGGGAGAGRTSLDALDVYVNEGIGNVPGWLSTDAVIPIRKLAEAQVSHGVDGGAAEIGVHQGQLFILLALLVQDTSRAVGYDLFERQDENLDGSGRGNKKSAHSHLVSAGVARTRFDLVTANSLELTVEDLLTDVVEPVRLFSVDGGHTPEITTNDLDLAQAVLADGGIVILDDVFSQMWPGVGEGLRTFMDTNPGSLVPFGLTGNKTLLCRPHWHHKYLAVLNELSPHFQTRSDRFYSSRVRILLDH